MSAILRALTGLCVFSVATGSVLAQGGGVTEMKPEDGFATRSAANLYNPSITVFGDFAGNLSTNSDDKTLNRFAMREIELDMRAAVAPWVDGVLAIAIAEEVEEEGGEVEAETHFEFEEGYLNFHTLPWDLSLKAGRFRSAIGRQNQLHLHDIPQVTRPLATVAFLGHHGLVTNGVSVSRLVPNPWDDYMEFTAEVVNADGGEEAPILGGPNSGNPAALARLKWFTDVGETSTTELAGTYLYTRTGSERDSEGHVVGLDWSYQWLDPEAPDSRSFLLQAEAYWAANDVEDPAPTVRNRSWGGYAFGQYQVARDWYVGLRGDYTEFPDDEERAAGDSDWAASPYVTWYITEFLRLRFEYQHHVTEIAGVEDSQDNFFLNLTWVYGAHPPHPYWVNR